jgi:hypothetical protein
MCIALQTVYACTHVQFTEHRCQQMRALGFRAMQCPRVTTEQIQHSALCAQCISIEKAKLRAEEEEHQTKERRGAERYMDRKGFRKMEQEGEKKKCCVM